MKQRSELEATMALHIKAARLPEPEREYRFHPARKWRADFAWPAQKVLLECDGGMWTGGRHNRGGGRIADMERDAAAVLDGWRVFRVAECHIRSGEALRWVEAALQSATGGFVAICPPAATASVVQR